MLVMDAHPSQLQSFTTLARVNNMPLQTHTAEAVYPGIFIYETLPKWKLTATKQHALLLWMCNILGLMLVLRCCIMPLLAEGFC